MASPQLEDGYLKIANDIWDAMIAYRIPGEQMQCLMYIIRKTYGFNKKEDRISLAQFIQATGIGKRNVIRALNALIEKRLISVVKKDTERYSTYRFTKDFESWKVVSKKTPGVSKKTPKTVQVFDITEKLTSIGVKNDTIQGVSKKTPTGVKNDTALTNTKDTLSKDILSCANTQTAKPQKADPDFDTFWSAYPKKRDKGNALKAWRKLNGTRPTLEVILKAITDQKQSADWTKDNGQFIPYPATWLNGQRWEDEVTVQVHHESTPSLKEL
jgi:phage replication O-like protein O